jgi:pSer/pThr/pTyr-binding forkhead associated (FHA) protein
MSEDRTTPMQQPEWSRRKVEPDDQATILAGQDSPTPPTMPAGAPGPGGWETPGRPDFVRTTPTDAPTPRPQQRPAAPFQPASREPAQAPEGATMLISQQKPRPTFAWLVMVDGPDNQAIGTVYPLQADTTSIGRVKGNQIVLQDETCSSQHARIRVEAQEGADPEFILYDMGSRNGTFVGSRDDYKDEENKKYRHALQDGEYLLLGETTLAFKRL